MNRWAATEAVGPPPRLLRPPPRQLRPPRPLRQPQRPLQRPPRPLGRRRGCCGRRRGCCGGRRGRCSRRRRRWATTEVVGPPPRPLGRRRGCCGRRRGHFGSQRPLQRPPRPLRQHSKRWGYRYSFFFYKMSHNFAQIRPEMGRKSVKNWPLGGLVMPKNASGGLSGLVRGPAHH